MNPCPTGGKRPGLKKAKKVYYLGDCETLELWDKDEYEVLEIVDGMFKIKDDLGREYLYSPNEKIRITRLTCRGKICIMNAVS